MAVLKDPRYEAFALAMVTEPSQAAALRKSHKPAANWPASKCHETASRWAALPQVQARVAEIQQSIAREVVLEQAEIVRAIRTIALSDIRGIVDEKGQLRLPNQLDDATAAAVSKFKITDKGTIEYQFHNKVSALDQACKILGLYERDNRQKTDPLSDLLGKLSGKVLGVTADNSPDDDDEDEDDIAPSSHRPARRGAGR